jgi:hypothetical protein
MERSDAEEVKPPSPDAEELDASGTSVVRPMRVERAPEPGRRCAICDVAAGQEHLSSCKYTGIYTG